MAEGGVSYGVTVGLLIDEVAPAANGLPQRQRGGGEVRQRGKAQLARAGEDPPREQRRQHAAIDGHAAFAHGKDLPEVVLIKVPLEGHVVEPRAHQRRRHAHEGEVYGGILGKAEPFFALHGQQHAQQHAQSDERAVIVQGKIADDQRVAGPFHHSFASLCPPL